MHLWNQIRGPCCWQLPNFCQFFAIYIILKYENITSLFLIRIFLVKIYHKQFQYLYDVSTQDFAENIQHIHVFQKLLFQAVCFWCNVCVVHMRELANLWARPQVRKLVASDSRCQIEEREYCTKSTTFIKCTSSLVTSLLTQYYNIWQNKVMWIFWDMFFPK